MFSHSLSPQFSKRIPLSPSLAVSGSLRIIFSLDKTTNGSRVSIFVKPYWRYRATSILANSSDEAVTIPNSLVITPSASCSAVNGSTSAVFSVAEDSVFWVLFVRVLPAQPASTNAVIKIKSLCVIVLFSLIFCLDSFMIFTADGIIHQTYPPPLTSPL